MRGFNSFQRHQKDLHDMALHSLSLCTGAAGLELGLQIALGREGVQTVCYVEREAYAAANLVARMESEALDSAPIWDDIRTFDGTAWCNKVHLIAVGYPCQPFSYAGKQRGTDDPRHLWPHVLRILRESEAPLLFGENVTGHLNNGFETVVGDLQELGYCVAGSQVSAQEAGAPHRRERLFFLAAHPYRCELWQQPRGEKSREKEAQSGVLSLDADSHPGGQQGQRLQEIYNRRWASHWDDTNRFRGEVSDPPSEGREGLPDSGEKEDPEFGFGYGGWNGSAPEPALHRMDAGMAYRVDRLRLTGNGVVPLVAAKAFLSMYKEITASWYNG